jgi:hypothetical protein
MAVALGALAFGAAAAFLNSERTRKLREDLERQIQDVSNRLERGLAERRPDIEQAIQRSRQAAVTGLEKAKGAVEVSADKAQEYVHRASVRTSEVTAGAEERVGATMQEAGEPIEAGTSSATTPESWTSEPGAPEFSGGTDMRETGSTGEPTGRMDGDGNSDIATSNQSY